MFDENLTQLKDSGVNTWQIPVEEAREHLPGLNTDGLGRVAFEPESGYADPHAATNSLIEKARANGAEAYENRPATDIRLDGDKVMPSRRQTVRYRPRLSSTPPVPGRPEWASESAWTSPSRLPANKRGTARGTD